MSGFGELLEELKRRKVYRVGIAYGIAGLAVLPFENMSGTPEDLQFTDGIHEEILSRLANVQAFHVISGPPSWGTVTIRSPCRWWLTSSA